MKIPSLILSSLIISHLILPTRVAFADSCDFSTGIKKVPEGYLYSVDCHKEVGKIVHDNDDRAEEITSLKKQLTYKDLIIDAQDRRTDLWRETSFKLEDKITSYERFKRDNELLYFGLGILVTVGAGYALGQASKASK